MRMTYVRKGAENGPKRRFWGVKTALAVAPGGLRGRNVKMGNGNTFDFLILFSILHRLFTDFFGFFRDFCAGKIDVSRVFAK
jgi:hypothetical protein